MKNFLPLLTLFVLTLSSIGYSQVPSSETYQEPEKISMKSNPIIRSTAASLPKTMSYQGLLSTSMGTPVADGSYDLQFDLYDSSTVGSSQWTETHNGVDVQRGTFNVILGSISSLDIDFNKRLYVEVKALNGPAGPSYPLTFSPRTELTSAPYALAPWSANGGGLYYNGGKIGLGTQTPSANGIDYLKLEIADEDGSNSDIAMRVAGTGGGYPVFNFAKSRGTLTTPSAVNQFDLLGQINFLGYTGTLYAIGAAIRSRAFAAPSASRVPSSLDFYTSGENNRMRIDSSGNVGIGTIAPDNKLSVNRGAISGSGVNDVLRISGGNLSTAGDATGLLFVQRDSEDDYGGYIRLITTNTSPNFLDPRMDFGVQDNGTNLLSDIKVRMTILGGGNVGIGTTTPTAKLHIGGTPGIDGIRFPDGSLQTSAGVGSASSVSSATDALVTGDNDNTGSGDIRLVTGLSDKMRITNGGNVGIGTANPQSSFVVQGSSNWGVGEVVGAGTNAEASIGFRPSNLNKGALGTWVLGVNNNGGQSNAFSLYAANGLGYGSQVISVLPSGNVGIGMTGPSFKLDVNGIVNATDVYKNGLPLSTSQWTTSGANIYYNSGNVGIGTTSPAAQLHVHDSSNSIIGARLALTQAASGTNITDGVALICTSPNGYVWNYENGPLLLGTNGVERMRIGASGNVGIGASSPLHQLHVYSAGGETVVDIQNASTGGRIWQIYSTGTANGEGAGHFMIRDGTSGVARVFVSGSTGDVGIGTTSPAAKLHVNGDAGNNTGVWSNLSDGRLKKEIEPIQNALKTVEQLQGVTFRWKDSEKDTQYGRVRGMIAQDVERVIPDWVKTDPDGYKRLEPIGIDALLIEAIKEQQREIEELKELVKSLASEKKRDGNKSIGELK
ncbi:MAG: tail fiber domain-containing protein [Ignavibacteriae bacterium]|nr:tail fiber domain-containing protein [Ignavibacteriota bacterium]